MCFMHIQMEPDLPAKQNSSNKLDSLYSCVEASLIFGGWFEHTGSDTSQQYWSRMSLYLLAVLYVAVCSVSVECSHVWYNCCM